MRICVDVDETSGAEVLIQHGHMRILATSDVHMHLSGGSETTGEPTPQSGLARLARLIDAARKSAPGASLLVDNGDLLQGTPLAVTCRDFPRAQRHPLAAFLEAVGYDALGLGNHDFDFGPDYLAHFIAEMHCPVLSANARGVPGLKSRCLLPCTLPLEQGGSATLQVGVTSALPLQTAQWAGSALGADVSIDEPLAAIEQQVAALREEGADLVLVAAHGGLDPVPEPRGSEHFAGAVRKLPGVGAVIAGHLHMAIADAGDAEQVAPCVMPSYGAAHLGCIDLVLAQDASGWHVQAAEARLLEVGGAEPLPELLSILEPLRSQTAARVVKPIARTDVHLHSYFAMLQSSAAVALVAEAMMDGLERMALPDDWADLPKLAAIAPILVGGRGGPDQFCDVRPGPVSLAATEALFPYEDVLTARRMSGADLRLWLDRAAAIYGALDDADDGNGALLHPQMPGFCFDMIHGLTVRIDPTRPARFSPKGAELDPGASRLTCLEWQGRPVQDTDHFVLGLSSYRSGGGGNYPDVGIRLPSGSEGPQIRRLVCDVLDARKTVAPAPLDWAIEPGLGVSATIDTSPQAAEFLDDIAKFSPEIERVTAAGFLRLRVHL